MFAYSFRLMDLDTGMYLAWGSSMRSEKEAFETANRRTWTTSTGR
ncbi:MAG: hypothetical protein ACP5RJ_00440 [Conexivisphaera sp.]